MKIAFDYIDALGMPSYRVIEVDKVETARTGRTLLGGVEIVKQYRTFDVTRMKNVVTVG